MRSTIIAVALVLWLHTTAHSQTELGSSRSTSSSSWSLLSLQRTWLPQQNDFPNWGFGVQAFSSISNTNRHYLGFGILGAGVAERNVVAIVFGPGTFVLGDGSLGVFAFLQGGVVVSSQSGATLFNLFGDVSMQFGLGATSGLGACVAITDLFRLQVAVVANAYTVDGGSTPYGIQFGLSTGGK